MSFDRAIKGYGRFLGLVLPWIIILIPLKYLLDSFNIQKEIVLLIITIVIIICVYISLNLFKKYH